MVGFTRSAGIRNDRSVLLLTMSDDDKAWPEEEEAIKNIKEGKTKMETVSAEKLLKELKELEGVGN